jgi:hypothetical protein
MLSIMSLSGCAGSPLEIKEAPSPPILLHGKVFYDGNPLYLPRIIDSVSDLSSQMELWYSYRVEQGRDGDLISLWEYDKAVYIVALDSIGYVLSNGESHKAVNEKITWPNLFKNTDSKRRSLGYDGGGAASLRSVTSRTGSSWLSATGELAIQSPCGKWKSYKAYRYFNEDPAIQATLSDFRRKALIEIRDEIEQQILQESQLGGTRLFSQTCEGTNPMQPLPDR